MLFFDNYCGTIPTMIWIQEKYIQLISYKLPLFKKVGHNKYAFRCPICGDSKKNPYKTRGGIYVPPHSDDYNMGCFNCGASMKFTSFLKLMDENLYNEYRLETFIDSGKSSQSKKPVVEEVKEKIKKFDMASLTRLDMMQSDHPAMRYIESRKIPREQWHRLYYCKSYFGWISKFDGKKYNLSADHPRLIIPFFDRKGNVTRIAARSFGNEEPRYLYSVSDRSSTRLFGFDQIDPKKPVYVLEGPLDSLFFENAVAVGMASYDALELNQIPNKIFVPDNQPRNADVCKNLKKVIDRGDKVCLWIRDTEKDINEMVTKGGMTMNEIQQLIQESTVSGWEAVMRFSQWNKS